MHKDSATPSDAAWLMFESGLHELTGYRVLVVEDDYSIAEEMGAVLRRKGALVLPAPDVESGRVLMARQPFDCAVLDVNLHGEHVFQLAGELRACGVPSVFATGYDAAFLPVAFRDAVYLQKPINLAALVRAVRQCGRRTNTGGQTA